MSEPDLDDLPPHQIAAALATELRRRLDNLTAEAIVLTRDEAALTLGLVTALAELLDSEAARRG